jgi:hypothetical protein
MSDHGWATGHGIGTDRFEVVEMVQVSRHKLKKVEEKAVLLCSALTIHLMFMDPAS